MMRIHADDLRSATARELCPISKPVNHNFVSHFETDSLRFSEHYGPLSIKCAFRGAETYELGRARFQVDAGSYLVLNNASRYSSLIESAEKVESFCIWFRTGFAEQVLSGLCTPAHSLLDEPRAASRLPVEFFERTYPHDTLVSPVVRRMRDAVIQETITPEWLEEQFHEVTERLLQVRRNVYRDVELLPALRASTRLELYRRLYHARDYLESALSGPVSLAEVAEVADLSPHHFLRLFKRVFQETPREYHARRRMERAKDLLLGTDMPVTQICFEVGFESLGSFSWLFSRRYGAPPSRLRAQRNGGGSENSSLEEAPAA